MEQETIVRLKILSDTLSPETITETTGLACDKSWHPGDLRTHTKIVEKNNGWVLHSGLPRSASLDVHVESLLRTLEPAKEAIQRLSLTETVEISIVVYYSSHPALNFDSSTIERFGELGAGLDIDVFAT